MSAFKIRQDESYWREKLAAFLHDPPDKALAIRGHEERAKQIRDELYVSASDENLVKHADQVASGLDRTFLPETQEGGFINFREHSFITHPTGETQPLDIGSISTCSQEKILNLIQQDEEKLPKNQLQRSFSLFHYFRHVLPWRLAKENVCGLSWRWYVLPADTRLPDHSIWQHCALTSALYSCYKLSPERRASLMLFSITPVQDFITRSRKLRDYWTASLLLSWLASEGLWAVICLYGSDHLIYPFPVGQALIEARFDNICGFREWSERYPNPTEARAATLPNKFLFLVPEGEEETTARYIEEAVKKAWLDLAQEVKNLVKDKAFKNVPSICLEAFERIFERQVEHFWEFHWTAVPLLDENLFRSAHIFIPENLGENLQNFLEEARKKGLPYTEKFTEKFFYPASYDLLSRGLAAEKLSPVNARPDEPGIKCHLHPDFEALRFSCLECREKKRETCELNSDQKPDPNPSPKNDPCWRKIREAFLKSEFKDTERLSAIGLIKRLSYRAISTDHILSEFFRYSEKKFPSTTEIALRDWLDRAQKEMEELDLSPKEVAEILHQKETYGKEKYEILDLSAREKEIREKVGKLLELRKRAKDEPTVYDRYYALLVMDGDRMGRLLSGGFPAGWRDVLHPELMNRFKEKSISPNFIEFWQAFLERKRTLSPAVHGAISQALANFALYTVPSLVRNYHGTLIYAGGDDICAVFPISTALEAAVKLAEAYNWAFVRFRKESVFLKRKEKKIFKSLTSVKEVREASEIKEDDTFLFHLGPGKDISISAGLLIVHHKWPLRSALARVHSLLKMAKESGRAALALELHRRAGERRTFVSRFKETVKFKDEEIPVWEAFNSLARAFASRRLSSAFAYRVRELEEGIRTLSEYPEEVARFIKTQIKTENKQDINDSEIQTLCRQVTTVLLGERKRGEIMQEEGDRGFGFEALEIARFLGEAR